MAREGQSSSIDGIDVSPAQVVNDDDVVSLIAQVQTRRPTVESVAAEDDDLLLLGAVHGGFRIEGGAADTTAIAGR